MNNPIQNPNQQSQNPNSMPESNLQPTPNSLTNPLTPQENAVPTPNINSNPIPQTNSTSQFPSQILQPQVQTNIPNNSSLEPTKTPEVFSQNPTQKLDNPKPYKPKKFNLLAVFLIILFFIIASFSGLAYAVSYKNVSLGLPEIEQKISHIVMGIPFTPKTPKFIMEKSAIVQKDMSKYSFNASMSAKSDDLKSLVQTDELNMEFTGKIDATDLENAKFELNGSITKQFNFDLKSLDQKLYFKINQIPELIFALLGIDQKTLDPLLNQWVSYDFSNLETQASEYLDSNKKMQSPTEYYTQENLEKWLEFATSDDFQKNITLEEEEIFGKKAFKINIKVNEELFAKIEEMEKEIYGDNYSQVNSEDFSKIFENFEISLWIEKEAYYTRKIASSFTLNFDTKGLTPLTTDVLGAKASQKVLGDNTYQTMPKINMAFVMTIDDIGKEIIIDIPIQTTTLEEYILKLQKTLTPPEDDVENEILTEELLEDNDLDSLKTDIKTDSETDISIKKSSIQKLDE